MQKFFTELEVKKMVTGRWFEEELGRADELGSGVRNIFEYYKYYSNNKTKLEENDVFHCVVYTDKIKESQIAMDNSTENLTKKSNYKLIKN
jgi:ATP-dependent DNA helicase RecG